MKPLIDIGLNLASPRLLPRAEALLQTAAQAGVKQVIVTGSDPESNQEALVLAQQFPKTVFFTAGHHPHHANDWKASHRLLIQYLARESACVALGEMGLDYFRNLALPERQRHCFYEQLQLAVDAQKTVFLHEREAYADFKTMLLEALPDLKAAVWHCFTGTRAQMEEMAAAGLYFGITGWLCDPERGQDLRETVRHIPAERLLIETDAPYLTPKTLQPRPYCNEPRFLPEVLRVLALCREEDEEVLAAQIYANTLRCFALELL